MCVCVWGGIGAAVSSWPAGNVSKAHFIETINADNCFNFNFIYNI